jgi:hypothetical protein
MKLRTIIYFVSIALAAGVWGSVWHYTSEDFPKFYEEKMRASLFTGFFTLSGFLLSAMTFIVLNLKKEMFSTDLYLRHVKNQQPLVSGGRIRVYKPLRDIGHVLLLNVALCLISSALQFTIGIIAQRWAVATCLAAAASAGGMMVFSLIVIARNLHDMYEHFEQEAHDKIEKMSA